MDDSVKKIVNDMMSDPTCEVELFSGMKNTTVEGDEDESFEPDGSKTVVLKIKGGANNVEINRVKLPGEE